MEIPLDLSRHCIATEVKRQYNRAMSDYFNDRGDPSDLEERIEMLTALLRQGELPVLRGRHPGLDAHSPSDVRLRKKKGAVQIILDGRTIYALDLSKPTAPD
jgi:hypothetical protein